MMTIYGRNMIEEIQVFLKNVFYIYESHVPNCLRKNTNVANKFHPELN